MDLKVISGDNPLLSPISLDVQDYRNYDAYVDLSQITEEMEVRELLAIRFWTSESAAKLLVNELKESGRTVAMTGDGVNDVLALREADCSMAEGDGATRQIANLLDSDFTCQKSCLKDAEWSTM